MEGLVAPSPPRLCPVYVEQELRDQMPVGMSEFHLGPYSIVSLLPCLDVLLVIEETEFVLKDRANLLKAFPRHKPRVDPREVASVHDQVGDNQIATQELPSRSVHEHLKLAHGADRAGIPSMGASRR